MEIIDYVNPNEIDSLLNEIDLCVGLDEIKAYVHNEINTFRRKKDASPKAYRLILTGAIATGKSYLIEKIGRLLKAMGAIKGPIIGPVCARYIGHIGQIIEYSKENIDKLDGGLIIVDDFNTIINEEILSLTELLKGNKNISIIIATDEAYINKVLELDSIYKEMKLFNLKNYTPDELIEILKNRCHATDYRLAEDVSNYLKEKLEEEITRAGKNFSNIRYMYQLLDNALGYQSSRLIGHVEGEKLNMEALMTITLDDLKHVFEE